MPLLVASVDKKPFGELYEDEEGLCFKTNKGKTEEVEDPGGELPTMMGGSPARAVSRRGGAPAFVGANPKARVSRHDASHWPAVDFCCPLLH